LDARLKHADRRRPTVGRAALLFRSCTGRAPSARPSWSVGRAALLFRSCTGRAPSARPSWSVGRAALLLHRRPTKGTPELALEVVGSGHVGSWHARIAILEPGPWHSAAQFEECRRKTPLTCRQNRTLSDEVSAFQIGSCADPRGPSAGDGAFGPKAGQGRRARARLYAPVDAPPPRRATNGPCVAPSFDKPAKTTTPPSRPAFKHGGRSRASILRPGHERERPSCRDSGSSTSRTRVSLPSGRAGSSAS
jgi:hypothetical protein